MDKVDKKIKTYGIILGVILFVLLIAGFTYANLAWNSKSIVISGKSNCLEVESVKGSNITGGNLLLQDETSIINNNQITIKNGMVITNVTAKIKSTCSISGYMTLNLNVTNLSSAFTSSGNSTGALKYVIASYDPSTYSTVSTTALNGKTFDIVATGSITSTGTIKLKEENLSKTETKAYLVIFYIDGDMANNDAGSNSTNFKSNLEAIVTQGYASNYVTKEANMVDFITNLYSNEAKKTVINNGITYNSVKAYNLMNDRKGSSSTGIDDGNIRYYGASPNNYIYFNCSDYSNQSSSTCELWRIIGVFDGKVKIMRNEIIGALAWDQDKNIDSSVTTYDNNWSTASLQVLLNEKYYYGDTAGTITYYSGVTANYPSNLNITSFGIKNDKTRSMIQENTWKLGGNNSTNVFPNQIYAYENGTSVYSGNPTEFIGNVALPYASDYGYASDFDICKSTLYYYTNSNCIDSNWMKPIIVTHGYFGWFLNPSSAVSTTVLSVTNGGSISFTASYNGPEVAPVLFLNSNVIVVSGEGSENSPYKINLT